MNANSSALSSAAEFLEYFEIYPLIVLSITFASTIKSLEFLIINSSPLTV